MESLLENRPLLYSLAGAGGFVVMLALGRFFHRRTVFRKTRYPNETK